MDFFEKIEEGFDWFPFGKKGFILGLVGISSSLGSFLLTTGGQSSFGESILFAMELIAAYGVMAYFLSFFLKNNHEKRMERLVPTVLSKAALLQQGPRYDQLVEMMCDSTYAPLNEVFQKVQGRLQSGSSFSHALHTEANLQSSFLIRRMLVLLAHGFDAGVDLRETLSQTAHYTRERFSQIDEAASEVWVEKITLLASAGLLIPFMSGSLSGLSSGSLNAFMADEAGEVVANQALLDAIHSGVAILQIELIVIASILAAFLEGKPSKAVLYIVVLGPLSRIVLWIASGMA